MKTWYTVTAFYGNFEPQALESMVIIGSSSGAESLPINLLLEQLKKLGQIERYEVKITAQVKTDA